MAKTTHLDLGRRERQILEVLFKRGRATVSEVLSDLADPPSYSTVRAMLGKLEKKGHVRHIEDGPRYLYLPAVPAERAQKAAMNNLVETFFQGSVESAAAALLRMSDTRVDQETLNRLATLVAESRKDGR